MKKVLVVCTGNICRSPMAQAWLSSRWGGEVLVESAGIAAVVGAPADPLAIEVAAEAGLDLTAHVARQIGPAMVREADLVLVMESRQREHLIKLVPSATGKIWRYGQKDGLDVPDPYRLGKDSFLLAFHSITRQGESWLSFAKAP